MTPTYAPAYPYATKPAGLAGRLTAARRFGTDVDLDRLADEVVAGRLARNIVAVLTEHGRPLPGDLAESLHALLTGDTVDAGVIA